MKPICSLHKVLTKDGKEIVVCDETRSQLLPLLEAVHDAKGYVSDRDMQEIADRLGIHPVEVYSVVTFYSFLTAAKKGKHFIRVSGCLTDEMAGGDKTLAVFEKTLGVKAGGTTKDGKITLETTGCIGMCDRPPSAMIDDKLVGGVTPAIAKKIVKELRSARPPKKSVIVPFAKEDVKRSGPVIFSPIEPYAGLKKALDAGIGRRLHLVDVGADRVAERDCRRVRPLWCLGHGPSTWRAWCHGRSTAATGKSRNML